jgi:hypothetical protein
MVQVAVWSQEKKEKSTARSRSDYPLVRESDSGGGQSGGGGTGSGEVVAALGGPHRT